MKLHLKFTHPCEYCKKETEHIHIQFDAWQCNICSTEYQLVPSVYLERISNKLRRYSSLLSFSLKGQNDS